MDQFLSIALSLDTLARFLCTVVILYTVCSIVGFLYEIFADTLVVRRGILVIRCLAVIAVFVVTFIPCYLFQYILHGIRGNVKRAVKSALHIAAKV